MSDSKSKRKLFGLGCFAWTIGLAALFLLLPVVVLLGWWTRRQSIAQREIDRRLAELVDEGLPVDTESLQAYYYRNTSDDSDKLWRFVRRENRRIESESILNELPVVGAGSTIPDRGQRWPDKPKVARSLSQNATLYQALHSLDSTGGPPRHPIDFDDLDSLKRQRPMLPLVRSVATSRMKGH